MTDQPIRLYGDSRSGNCYKLKLLCAEMGIGYDWREVDILAGALVSLLLACLQGTLEWIARQTAMSYLFYFTIAIIAALAHTGRRRAGYHG